MALIFLTSGPNVTTGITSLQIDLTSYAQAVVTFGPLTSNPNNLTMNYFLCLQWPSPPGTWQTIGYPVNQTTGVITIKKSDYAANYPGTNIFSLSPIASGTISSVNVNGGFATGTPGAGNTGTFSSLSLSGSNGPVSPTGSSSITVNVMLSGGGGMS